MKSYYLGVDVGTGSARCGVFDQHGKLVATAKYAITTTYPQSGWAEQSTTEIWQAVCYSVRTAVTDAAIKPEQVAAIGFDATCSLALSDTQQQPLDLGGGRDVMVWMDQRATAEARQCSATAAEPLRYVGGTMSPEMQIPKLRWLKTHRPELWAKMGAARDLSDWLTWRASGDNARSVCTLTCKWGFMPHRTPSWDQDFLQAMDLNDLIERAALPAQALPVGAPAGSLNAQAANELGLSTHCVVAAGMIDAHAGAVLSFACIDTAHYPHSLGLVAGTSNCHMAMHSVMQPVSGVWGPYQGVVFPQWWLNEGGQTTSGALLQYLSDQLRGSDAYAPNVHERVSTAILERLTASGDPAPDLHILPDLLGNRSPHAEPRYRGVISGLSMNAPQENFLQQYWAAACAVAYGTRAIIERLNSADYAITQLILTGGHAKSPLLIRLYADACNCELLLPQSDEPVLLGAAMTAAAAHQGDLAAACAAMKPDLTRHTPDTRFTALHEQRYQRFLTLYEDYARTWQ
ncbi:MAG: FGGY family pentulose kinase [Neisseria sp.]|nr:FGGY family pentulose kinase [Neisseria sp.]